MKRTIVVVALLIGLAVPVSASASLTRDLSTEITNTSPLSAKTRSATVTLTNHGPDPFIGCQDVPASECFLGGPWYEEPHVGILMQVEPDYRGDFTAATTSRPCTPFTEGIRDSIRCNAGRTLGVGESVSVDVSFPAGTKAGDDSLYASDTSYEYEEYTEGETGSIDPNPENNPSVYVWPDEGSCELQAKGPQKANKALVVTVFGGTSGCEAKLKAAKLKIGNKVYTFIKKKPAKNVAPGEKWKVSVPIKGDVLKTVNKALADKKPVKAAAEFDLDGKSDSIVVKIK